VSAVEVEGNHLRCSVTGSVEPLLRALAAAGVRHLVSREPSLEDCSWPTTGGGRGGGVGCRLTETAGGNGTDRLERSAGGPPRGAVGLVFGGMIAATMAAYRSTFRPRRPGPASSARFQGNPAFEAIFA